MQRTMLSCVINVGITFLWCASMSVRVRRSFSSLAQASSGKAGEMEEWEGNAPKCACGGCEKCYTWPALGPGCWNVRRRLDQRLELHNMRCFDCGLYRDQKNASTQGKGAGKGKSSTGSDAAAGTASREDHARIAELREFAALRRDLNQLRSDFLNLQERVGRLEGW